MAPGLSRWVVAGVAACCLIAVGYLPPRGSEYGWWRPMRDEAPSAAQRHVSELERQFRDLDQRLRVAIYRREAEPALAARRASGQPGAELVLNPNDTVIQALKPGIVSAVDSAWTRLQLGTPKVAMLLVIPTYHSRQMDSVRAEALGPIRFTGSVYLLPDSTDRTTCVGLIAGGEFWFDQAARRGRLTDWVATAFGPCAFYARFGAPSARVHRWLDQGRYDVVANSDWLPRPSRDALDDKWNRFLFWRSIDDLRFGAVACLAGRPVACRDAIRRGDDDGGGPFSRVAFPGANWRRHDARILNHEEFLARIVQQVGEQQFQGFWTTSLPIDSALTVALREPVGEWVARWQGTVAPRPRLGAAPRWVDALLSLVLVGIVLAGVVVVGQRRQVR